MLFSCTILALFFPLFATFNSVRIVAVLYSLYFDMFTSHISFANQFIIRYAPCVSAVDEMSQSLDYFCNSNSNSTMTQVFHALFNHYKDTKFRNIFIIVSFQQFLPTTNAVPFERWICTAHLCQKMNSSKQIKRKRNEWTNKRTFTKKINQKGSRTQCVWLFSCMCGCSVNCLTFLLSTFDISISLGHAKKYCLKFTRNCR